MARDIEISVDEYYHLYNRGVDKRPIFLCDDDYTRFLRLLHVCNSDKPVVYKFIQGLALDKIEIGIRVTAVGAQCLMPNHFHLLAKEVVEGGITKFMSKLSTAYSMYFNKKYNRTGALLESKFKAKHITSDDQLKYLYTYIHLNPVKIIEPEWKKNGIKDLQAVKKYLSSYHYSSYLDYQNSDRVEGCLLSKSEFPEYFGTKQDFQSEISEWLEYERSLQGQALE